MAKPQLIVLSLFATLAQTVTAAPTPVALSGSAAPAGGSYGGFGIPALNGAGQVAFHSTLTGGTSTEGIFAGLDGAIQAAALQGTPAPAGGNYSALSTVPVLNSTGQVAFQSTLTGGSSAQGIFSGAPGSIQPAALTGAAAPAGGNYSSLLPPELNGAGRVAFAAVLTGGSSAEGIFAGVPGSLQTVAVTGAAAPAGGNYNGFLTSPFLNEAGQVAIAAGLTGSSIQGLFAGAPGSLQTVALQGTPAPAGGNYSALNVPALNDTGRVVFQATLTGSSATQGIFAGVPGSIQAVARRGDAAPAGGNYSTFGIPVLNNAGQVAFTTNLFGGSSTAGLFAGVPGSLQTAALVGSAAPVSAGSAGNYNTLSRPVLNDAGQLAFRSNLIGSGIDSTNDTTIFAGSPGSLMQVVREGELIDVDPGPAIDNRTVAADGIGFNTISSGLDGRGLSFNDNGLLVYRLTFTDGSSGIFTSVVPEPASLALLSAGIGVLLRRRRVREYKSARGTKRTR